MVLRLYLVRHGQAEWSLSGLHTGRSDIPATTDGEAGARILAPHLGKLPSAHVLNTPRQPARRTFELAGPRSASVVNEDLAAWDYGDYNVTGTADVC